MLATVELEQNSSKVETQTNSNMRHAIYLQQNFHKNSKRFPQAIGLVYDNHIKHNHSSTIIIIGKSNRTGQQKHMDLPSLVRGSRIGCVHCDV